MCCWPVALRVWGGFQDDIVRALVDELVRAAAGSWVEQCVHGKAVDFIAEHLAALSTEQRVDAYVGLLLDLGARSSEDALSSSNSTIGLRPGMGVGVEAFPIAVRRQHEPVSLQKARAMPPSVLRAELLKQCARARQRGKPAKNTPPHPQSKCHSPLLQIRRD